MFTTFYFSEEYLLLSRETSKLDMLPILVEHWVLSQMIQKLTGIWELFP